MTSSVSIVELRQVAKFIRGITFKPEDKVEPFSNGSVVCFRTKNVQTQLDEEDLFAVPKRFVKRDEQYVRGGDILVSTANSWELVGKCSWVPELDYSATIGGFISLIRAKPDKVNPRYLYHWFNSPETQLQARNCGRQTTNISNMNIGRAEQLRLPLPPLPEQRRIAAVLDAADALRAKRRAALGKLDALLQSVFLEMFGDPVRNERGWEVTKLDNVVSYIGSGITPLGGSSVYSTEGQLFIRSQNVLMFDFDFSDAAYIDDSMHQDMRRTWVKHNDVLLNITGASIGRANFYSGKDDSANVNQHVCIIRPIDQRILPAYLTYHLGMPSYQNKIIGQNAGATRQAFNFKQIRDFNLMLPPLRLQSRFSDAWEKVRGLRQRQHCAYEKQVRLFHSLQQRAFRGEL